MGLQVLEVYSNLNKDDFLQKVNKYKIKKFKRGKKKMESVYAALLLHKASKKITEAAIEKILTAAGVKSDKSQITKLVAGLKEADIDNILASAVAAPVMATPASGGVAPKKPEVKEEKKEEEEEEEPTGIGSLF